MRALNYDNTVFRVDLHDTQVLDCHLLSSHSTSHLLAWKNSASASLRGTSTTHGSVGQTVTVTGRLTAETPSLHSTSKAHSPAVCPSINKLALLEPISVDDGSDGEQALLVLDSELVQVSLDGHLVCSEMTSLRPRDVARLLCASSDLDGKVAVLLARLV